MATYTKFDQFVEDIAKGVHNLLTGAITVALTAAAHAPVAGNKVLADLTEVSYTYCSTRVVTVSACAQSSGTLKMVCTDLTLTATGGDVGPFQYVIIYNDTPTSPANPLICFFTYGSEITLHTTETILLDFDGTNGLLQIA